jgi:hypothetical protein
MVWRNFLPCFRENLASRRQPKLKTIEALHAIVVGKSETSENMPA